ncbi:MAG: NAD-dependent epimerase/dehydratase family protein [Bacillota bacterium]
MILVTGADGYLGWPTLLKLSKVSKKELIIGIDNLQRRKWVENIGGTSAIPIYDMQTRVSTAKQNGFENIHFIEGDLADREFTYQILKQFKPRVIVHLAAQPSAPYSHINGQLASYTQENNNAMLRNLLWGMKELDLNDTHLITTTTTGVYGAPELPIPEGFLDIRDGDGNVQDRIIYPGMATSWYHMSKANDVNNLYLAHHMWKFPLTDIRTSIVFGTDTDETVLDPKLATRFDFDFYFGVVPNRFCAQALSNHPITIYGQGNQRKPFITLNDAVTSIVNAVHMKKERKFEVFNQYSLLISPKELAEAVESSCKTFKIPVEISHVSNPRIEKEDHNMIMENSGFLNRLLKKTPETLTNCIEDTIKRLVPFKETIVQYNESIFPR